MRACKLRFNVFLDFKLEPNPLECAACNINYTLCIAAVQNVVTQLYCFFCRHALSSAEENLAHVLKILMKFESVN